MSARKRALFSKLQEEKRAKKMREDEDTARLYEDFVEQFMAPENGSQVIQFTQGGVVNENAASPPEQDKLDDVKQTVPPIAIPKGSLPHQINLNPQEKKNKTEETNNTVSWMKNSKTKYVYSERISSIFKYFFDELVWMQLIQQQGWSDYCYFYRN
eukprot:TRINITY_DN29734_c0_g1_i1.p2 TRINITY_DN29734_c0_g1~~TRINITY_DN29734_c0_g1_i1.p2  ORF type:complete len:156 (-),score=18.08 TRINITY_DN29734_c0_g1_i1:117-584(-)